MAFESYFEDFATRTTDSLLEMQSPMRGLCRCSPLDTCDPMDDGDGGLAMMGVGMRIEAVFLRWPFDVSVYIVS